MKENKADYLTTVNPFPSTENRGFGVSHLPWRSPARNSTKFGHIKAFLRGFFDCIPENGGPTVRQPAGSPRFARAAP